ncbi:LytTR family DNA-binding domain-containing protein [Xanthobacter sp. KR7-65]|uniref:LytTR family DNA-binding domain-containing protein n=1 Tax=Xanthobacter sp. KR7-65 TaxID=3156612 RepID=UPI0032B33D93
MREFASFQTNPWIRQRAAEGVFALALSPVFAWIGPFDVTEQEFLPRAGYWAGVLACWFVSLAVAERLFEIHGIARRRPPQLRWLAAVAATAAPIMIVVAPATHMLTGWLPYPTKVVALYFQIIILGAGVSLIARGTFGLQSEPAKSREADRVRRADAEAPLQPADPLPAAAGAAPIALVARLPPAVRGALVAVEMEDHYARVHTERGSGLVLLRLSDAIAETRPTPGRQVHRSWWVADSAITRFERAGRAGRLHLANGVSAPVSQRYLREVEAMLSDRSGGPAFDKPRPEPARLSPSA